MPFFLKQARDIGVKEITVYRNPHGDVILPSIWAGNGSHRKPGGIIGAPYLDGVQHLEFPPTKGEPR